MKNVILSEKSKALYDSTYKTLIYRLKENGYAQTSLTGAYCGMFVRDASIQVMAHIAEGDFYAAKRILQYMTAYHMALGDRFAVHVMDDLSCDTDISADAHMSICRSSSGEETVLSLPNLPAEHNVVYADIPFSACDAETLTAALYKGDIKVDETRHKVTRESNSERFLFCLPLCDTSGDAAYSIRIYGTDFVCENAETGVPVHIGLKKDISPLSRNIQPDGNYMWVHAFCMFALKCKEEYSDFTEKAYPLMAAYSRFYQEDADYLHPNGLIRNPMYEHSREGRYFESYDLITNVFASQALHEMSLLAHRLGKAEDAGYFASRADSLAKAIKKELTSELDGQRIYTELIALDEGGKVIPGFSFVSLAPIAAEWYAADEELVRSTYGLYRRYATEIYHEKYPVIVVCRELDPLLEPKFDYDHVIGKGLAWEIRYLYDTGDLERLEMLLEFVSRYSNEVYPEVWTRDGKVHDSANQEQVSWVLYEIAYITGKYR